MSVVFTDSFVVGVDTNIDAYPAGSPDYAYNRGSGSNLVVAAATDRVGNTVITGSNNVYLLDPVVPTGDQEITGTVRVNGSATSYVSVRNAPAEKVYYVTMITTTGNDTNLRRRDDASTLTIIASADLGLVNGDHTMRLRATGSGATVTLSVWIDDVAALTYEDTSANRLTSGPPGLGISASVLGLYVDNVSVDDLGGAPAAVLIAQERSLMRRIGGRVFGRVN